MSQLPNQKIVILRAPSLGATRDPFDGPGAAPGLESTAQNIAERAVGLTVDREENPSNATLTALRNDPTVLGFAPAMPMKLIEPLAADAAPAAAATWGVKAVGADKSPFTGAGVTVSVLDTGIDATHPAFAGVNLVTKDFTGAGSADDDNGHGTHCAGTIFGRDLSGQRIGVAPGVQKAVIGKVLGGPNGGSSDILASAMLWAADNGAQVISMSLGMDFPGWVDELVKVNGLTIPAATSIALEGYRANVRLFEQLANLLNARASVAQTTVVVAAAGNESERNGNPAYEINVAPPAAAYGITSVAALADGASGLTVAPFSNTMATVAGPGVGVFSAWLNGGTKTISGTSMATPHVAGVAALWAEKLLAQGPLSPVLLQAKLIASGTFRPLAAGTDPVDVGAGLVQAPTNAN
ncbi:MULTISPECIES: S8 family peptidase [Pseudarthrobacter]|jgi:subtilisin family serine protease|uniref:S8 family peptidase n=1 Tax=Pseudarthrobacter TaxID=1742993 RepID=UPI0012FCB51F|nr:MULTISPECIES: S8 family serine peptidase [Pseudarthrobacter]MEA3550917.1 S8 family serine peptidase [Pseudarthrobacter sp. C1]MUU73762.1 S8 family serine peptidase [Pseudarthrobacter sp. GA104]WPU11200.1 S8 family serine peptidase [Pseudarthrobacter oxydans]